jgi:hypothetical protein
MIQHITSLMVAVSLNDVAADMLIVNGADLNIMLVSIDFLLVIIIVVKMSYRLLISSLDRFLIFRL